MSGCPSDKEREELEMLEAMENEVYCPQSKTIDMGNRRQGKQQGNVT